MLKDKEQNFNCIYKESSKEVNALANEGIKELYFGCNGELTLSSSERMLNRLRFQTIPDMLKVYTLIILTLIACALIAGLFRNLLGFWSEVVYAASEVTTGLFILTYMFASAWLHDRAWITVSLIERREITANLLVEKWVNRGNKVEDLMPVFKSSLDTLKKYQAFIKGGVITVGAFLSGFNFLFGDRFSLHKTVLAPLSFSSPYSPYIYAAIFLVIFLGAFVLITAPIGWRESLEPNLEQAIERYRRQRGE